MDSLKIAVEDNVSASSARNSPGPPPRPAKNHPAVIAPFSISSDPSERHDAVISRELGVTPGMKRLDVVDKSTTNHSDPEGVGSCGHPAPLQRADAKEIHRSRKSQHDMEPTMQSLRAVDEDSLLRSPREIDVVWEELYRESQRADQAEARVANVRNEALARLQKAHQTNQLAKQRIAMLHAEAKRLQRELEDAQSRVFALQPYGKDLTPEEMRRDYGALIDTVSNWVQDFMTPFLGDKALMSKLVAESKELPPRNNSLKIILDREGDLAHGCRYADTDIDVAIAITMRFLHHQILKPALYGAAHSAVKLLNLMEESMQTNLNPKRDALYIRVWRAEAYNALLSSRDFSAVREKFVNQHTRHLATIFSLFAMGRDWYSFCHNFEANCIRPAILLREKSLISTHHFYFSLDIYTMENSSQPSSCPVAFLSEIHGIHCANLLQNRKVFNMSKLGPDATIEEIQQNLVYVMTLTPGLYMRKVRKGDSIQSPMIVHKPQMLVAWGPPEARREAMDNTEPTLMENLHAGEVSRPQPA